jgi:hypothetical protein
MNVESPKYGAINRDALSSVPMLVIPPRKTIRPMNMSSLRLSLLDVLVCIFWVTGPAGWLS